MPTTETAVRAPDGYGCPVCGEDRMEPRVCPECGDGDADCEECNGAGRLFVILCPHEDP